jgi:predicted nucleic acid-binding protein
VSEKVASWLDSSAVLALLYGEPGTNVVRRLLEQAEREVVTLFLSALSLAEIVSSIAKTHNEEIARDDLRIVLEMPVQIASPSQEECTQGGWLRARHKLSTADAIIAAQAMAANAELVHKDPEFDQVAGLKHRRLPYKKKSSRRR